MEIVLEEQWLAIFVITFISFAIHKQFAGKRRWLLSYLFGIAVASGVAYWGYQFDLLNPVTASLAYGILVCLVPMLWKFGQYWWEDSHLDKRQLSRNAW